MSSSAGGSNGSTVASLLDRESAASLEDYLRRSSKEVASDNTSMYASTSAHESRLLTSQLTGEDSRNAFFADGAVILPSAASHADMLDPYAEASAFGAKNVSEAASADAAASNVSSSSKVPATSALEHSPNHPSDAPASAPTSGDLTASASLHDAMVHRNSGMAHMPPAYAAYDTDLTDLLDPSHMDPYHQSMAAAGLPSFPPYYYHLHGGHNLYDPLQSAVSSATHLQANSSSSSANASLASSGGPSSGGAVMPINNAGSAVSTSLLGGLTVPERSMGPHSAPVTPLRPSTHQASRLMSPGSRSPRSRRNSAAAAPNSATSMALASDHGGDLRSPAEASGGSSSSKRRKALAPLTPMDQSPLASGRESPVYSEEDDDSPEDGDSFVKSRVRIGFHLNDQETWHRIFDASMNEIPQPGFRVEIDKGFKRSASDDAFVCQKKNHFQSTVAYKLTGQPCYVATRQGLLKISALYIRMYGVRAEKPSLTVSLEQSQPDRSKKVFQPTPVTVVPNEVTKITVGRLHFSETTANNMRKKGKPNPDQRYFMLVVTLAARAEDAYYTIASHMSDKMIVRASNPGHFQSEPNMCWVKGNTLNSIYHAGAVGINTDSPDEALCVRGNIRLSGAILQPSDARLKRCLEPVDTRQELEKIANLPLYSYKLTEAWAQTAGIDENHINLGVLAQDLARIMPEAVHQASSVKLNNGDTVADLLVVDKERLFMANVGALKELYRLTSDLQQRLQQLEQLQATMVEQANSGSTGRSSPASSAHSNNEEAGDGSEAESDDGGVLRNTPTQLRRRCRNTGGAIVGSASHRDILSRPVSPAPTVDCGTGGRRRWSDWRLVMVLMVLALMLATHRCLSAKAL